MCYKKPGPRCSRHAYLALIRANEEGENLSYKKDVSDAERVTALDKIRQAEIDYDMTPEGQKELRGVIMQYERIDRPDKVESYKARLERGIHMRSLALKELKHQDIGDIIEHSPKENLYANITGAEGYPRERAIKILDKLFKKYGEPIGQGRNRVVFDTKDGRVIKVPITTEGFNDNHRESTWNDDYIPLAKCSIKNIESPGEYDFPLLVMEKVKPVKIQPGVKLPDWTGWVDCQQVGYNKKDELVAYDL